MRALIGVFCLLFVWGFAEASGGEVQASNDGRQTEAIEEVDLAEVQEVKEAGSGYFLGISKHRWLTVSGPVLWIFMAAGVATRHMRIKGKARQLNVIHKACGYVALSLGTLHGFLGLFF